SAGDRGRPRAGGGDRSPFNEAVHPALPPPQELSPAQGPSTAVHRGGDPAHPAAGPGAARRTAGTGDRHEPGVTAVVILKRPAAVLLVGLAGCGSSQDPYVVPLSPAEKHLTKIAMAYTDAHSRLGHGPKDAAELRPFLKEFGDPDELLVSPADGKPFVVIWGK